MADIVVKVVARGPYLVTGAPPLVERVPVETERGEPIAWRTGRRFDSSKLFTLCRCGQSSYKPFCDGSHAGVTTPESQGPPDIERNARVVDGETVSIDHKPQLCMHAGFCGSQLTNVWKMLTASGATNVESELIAMVERCPSGSITWALPKTATGDAVAEKEPVEPALPIQIGVIPDGPLWVTGGIAIELADGTRLETRNRVTLCRCGASTNKPLCDGTHREIGFHDPT